MSLLVTFLQEGNINLAKKEEVQATEKSFREITIPGDVLDDDRISDGAKITYGKIARLSYKTGYCWASNEFLGGTKTGRSAGRQIKELMDAGYLKSRFGANGSRQLYIIEINSKIEAAPHDENVHPGQKCPPATKMSALDENVHPGQKCPPATKMSTLDENVHPPGQKCPTPLDKNVHQTFLNLTNLNLTAATSPESPESSESPTPGDKPAAAAFSSPQELKKALMDIEKSLIFQKEFYPKAAAFLAQNNLDSGYLLWLYRQCKMKKPASLNGLFFKLFFTGDMTEKYAAFRQIAAAPPRPPMECPACGTLHDSYGYDDSCPACGLKNGDLNNHEQISFHRNLYGLPPEKQAEYLSREEAIYMQYSLDEQDTLEKLISELQKEYFCLETA